MNNQKKNELLVRKNLKSKTNNITECKNKTQRVNYKEKNFIKM